MDKSVDEAPRGPLANAVERRIEPSGQKIAKIKTPVDSAACVLKTADVQFLLSFLS